MRARLRSSVVEDRQVEPATRGVGEHLDLDDLPTAEPYVDEAYYVGFRVGDQEIGLDPNGHKKGMTRPVGYWYVGDIRSSLQLLLAAGAQAQQEVTDVGGGS